MVTPRTTSTPADGDANGNVREAVSSTFVTTADATVCQGTRDRDQISKRGVSAHRALTERRAHILLYLIREVRIVGAGCAELGDRDPQQPPVRRPVGRRAAHVAAARGARSIGTRSKPLHVRLLTSASLCAAPEQAHACRVTLHMGSTRDDRL